MSHVNNWEPPKSARIRTCSVGCVYTTQILDNMSQRWEMMWTIQMRSLDELSDVSWFSLCDSQPTTCLFSSPSAAAAACAATLLTPSFAARRTFPLPERFVYLPSFDADTDIRENDRFAYGSMASMGVRKAKSTCNSSGMTRVAPPRTNSLQGDRLSYLRNCTLLFKHYRVCWQHHSTHKGHGVG